MHSNIKRSWFMHMAYYGGHGGQLHMAKAYSFLLQRGSKQEGTSQKYFIHICLY